MPLGRGGGVNSVGRAAVPSTTPTHGHFVLSQVSLALKGLGHAILGNFSTDQMVIELTKI